MAKKQKNDGLKIAGLILNILIFPGIGSLVAGTRNGAIILVMAIVSIPLMFVLVGFVTLFIAWVCGIWDVVASMNEED